jgi:hypothetical protein
MFSDAVKISLLLTLASCCAALTGPATARAAGPSASTETPLQVRQLAQAAISTGDSQGLPFAIVDKKTAGVFVYRADGTLQGASPVLLGLAHGDESVPGIGERKISEISPEERTTPAGRFMAEPGFNLQGEDIVWVDYEAAVSMHRVRANNTAERRLERLASPNPEDHRISYGCINVPAVFYDTHVKPVLGSTRALIYVLPETQPLRAYFKFLAER